MQARKTILSIAVLAAMSGAAWADNSTVTTTQSGNDNLIEVDQQGATGSTITINQSGNDNVAGKQGSASFPPVKQTAKSSSIAINQINEQGGMASVDQGGGYYNTAIISQQNGGVGGGYDHATIKQNAGSDHGNSNFASISQDTAGYLGYQTASIQQADLNASGMGHGNQASIAQYRNGSATGDIGQSGNFNYASIAQSFNIGANAGVYQHGTGNQAAFGGWDSINQFNTVSSLAYVQQNGDYNRGSIAQSNGSHLSANLMQQDGVSNLAYLSQGGGDHLTANVTQTGSWNVASTTQTGSYNDIVLTQDGFGNSANVLQSGIGGAGLAMNKVNISQTGNGMVSNVSQLSGSGNVTNIVQH